MAIYDNLPYTNFHELNADWLLKQMKEAKAQVDAIQAEIDQFNEDYAALAAVFNVSGNNVSIPGIMTAGGFAGNLTGNVTGNLTGNASTATHATSADSATNATNATHATSADSATNATTADSATVATSAGSADSTDTMDIITTLTSTDLNDYVPDASNHFCIYNTPTIASNYPGLLGSNKFTVLAVRSGRGVLQLVFSPPTETDLWFRIRGGSSTWSVWKQISTV